MHLIKRINLFLTGYLLFILFGLGVVNEIVSLDHNLIKGLN